MTLDFLNTSRNYIVYSVPQISELALPILSNVINISYLSQSDPVGEELGIHNFGLFIEKIKAGTDLPIVMGSALENSTADLIETRFTQTIQLSGIVSLRSYENFITIQNRIGTFVIGSEVSGNQTIDSCVVLHLRDFGQNCLYFCGLNQNAIAIGVSGLSEAFNGQYVDLFSNNDAFLIRGTVERTALAITSQCHHINPPMIKILSISNLSVLNQNLG